MAKKRRHMTKHQYKTYKKTHRYNHSSQGDEQEENRHTKSRSGKYGQKSEKRMKTLLRGIQRHSDELLDEEEG
jgi:hypothetical protein